MITSTIGPNHASQSTSTSDTELNGLRSTTTASVHALTSPPHREQHDHYPAAWEYYNSPWRILLQESQ